MKICQIVASDAYGGLEKHVSELSNALAKFENLTVIAPGGLADRLSPDVRFIPLNLKGGRNNPLLLVRLARILRRERFDIIHAQANKATAMLGRIRGWVPGIKVGTLHNQKADTCMFARLDHAVAVSKGLAELLPEAVPHTVIYNGLRRQTDGETASREQICLDFGFDAARPLLLAVGRLVPAKGFDLLIEACGPLPINLLIVGDGPERAELTSLALQSHNATIRLAGHRQDVQALMACVDGVVISSRVEGFSYVFAEAMLAGCPVVSTSVPVADEVLEETWLAPLADPESLRRVILSAIQDRDAWRQSQVEAMAYAATHFTVNGMCDQTMKIYHELLAHWRAN